MIGSAVERQGIIRHGAKMVTAVSEATVAKVSVVVRKAYGAGLYAMSGPAFEPAATIALPTARIAVMGPEAAINAVYANKIAAIDDPVERDEFVAEQRAIYETDVDLLRLASELVIDAIIEPADAPRRADQPDRAGPPQGPSLRRPPPRHPPGLSGESSSERIIKHGLRLVGAPSLASARRTDRWCANEHRRARRGAVDSA